VLVKKQKISRRRRITMSTNNSNTTWKNKVSRNTISIISIIFAICCGSVASAWAQPVNGDIIPGEYIVAFKKTDPPATPTAIRALTESLVVTYGGQMMYVYEYAAPGFAAKLSARAVSVLQQDSRVDFIEPNRVIQLDPVAANGDAAKISNPYLIPPPVASWGLDRIDQRNLPLNGTYTYSLNGAGVNVYIIDTGIYAPHPDFGGRVVNGFDAFGGIPSNCPALFHGTHVAGTVGGAQYGVAKGVNLIAVRVLDCNGGGSSATVIAGINYVTQQKQLFPGSPAVANMSLGSKVPDPTVDNAVRDSIGKGITYAVAAGNDGQDPDLSKRNACNHSPARVDTAITVGATAINDKKAGFSNIGSCVSIFAPGQDITSASNTGGSAVLSGTSMATPHVAGVAALYLQSMLLSNTPVTPADVKSVILGQATLLNGVTSDIGFNSPNLLLYSKIPYNKNYRLTYRAHVAFLGWLSPVTSLMVAGTTGQNRQMEALKIYSLPSNAPPGMGIDYRAHVADLAWLGWVTAANPFPGQFAGTTGQSRRMEAAEIKLTNPPLPGCKVRYRAYVADLGWLSWVDNGQTAGTTGQSRQMEAIQIVCTCP
jgi:subtilisin family serine protease